MGLIHESAVYVNHAERFLGDKANIRPTIDYVRQHPEIANNALTDLDQAIGHLNRFINQPRQPIGYQAMLLPLSTILSTEVMEAVGWRGYTKAEGEFLPSPMVEAQVKSREMLEEARDVFHKANQHMLHGEFGASYGWNFHTQISDPTQLTNAMAIEMYGLLVAHKIYPLWDKNTTVVLAIEEMLAVHQPNSEMYKAIKDWYTTDEGFSPLLIGMIEGKIDIPFKFGQVIRETPNYVVFDGFKPGMEGREEGQRWFISPQTDQAEQMLVEAARLHHIDQSITDPKEVLASGTLRRRLLRTDRIADNLRPLLGGAVEIPEGDEDSVPSPDRLEECLSKHPNFYSFAE